MPVAILRSIADLCRTCAQTLDRYRSELRRADNVPVFPNCKPVATLPLGPCVVQVVASCVGDHEVEISLALYDPDDDRAPAHTAHRGADSGVRRKTVETLLTEVPTGNHSPKNGPTDEIA